MQRLFRCMNQKTRTTKLLIMVAVLA